MTDTIADLITRLRNARLGVRSIKVVNSNQNRAILNVLFKEGWINGWTIAKNVDGSDEVHNDKEIVVYLKEKTYDGSYGAGSSFSGRKRSTDKIASNLGTRLISTIVRVSKPSKRVYLSVKELPSDSLTTYVLSTSKGILTACEARKSEVGGEVLFYVK